MKSIREAYGEALVELGKENKNLVVLDADVSTSTRSGLFKEKFPERFFQWGILEGNMMAMAASLAATGKLPFVNTFATFATLRASDPLRSLIAYPGLNMKIAGGYIAGFPPLRMGIVTSRRRFSHCTLDTQYYCFVGG